ncbi:MAG: phosphoribosylanthranilate isomerase [Burkholderiaceae bacterium]|nr:phosphoribosylanthranilate isomerase [Burkholderiaceae bacterium]
MRTRIKFCGMVRSSDVDTAAALGVDAIGLVFHPGSSRFLALDDALALRRRVPSWVAVVGLFVDPAEDLLARTVARVGLDVVQFHGNESPAECAWALAAGVPYWRAVRVRGQADLLESFARFPAAEAFIADSWSSDFGGSGKHFDWSLIPQQRPPRLILAGGLTVANVGRSIAQVGPAGVDVSSGIQGADPREKDSRKMARFVQEVLLADARREAVNGEGDQ